MSLFEFTVSKEELERTNKMSKMKQYSKIADRAYEDGLYKGDRVSLLMDIESADMVFNIRLDEWLKADKFNFAHDLWGITKNIIRDEFPATNFGLFVPEFAGRNGGLHT